VQGFFIEYFVAYVLAGIPLLVINEASQRLVRYVICVRDARDVPDDVWFNK